MSNAELVALTVCKLALVWAPVLVGGVFLALMLHWAETEEPH